MLMITIAIRFRRTSLIALILITICSSCQLCQEQKMEPVIVYTASKRDIINLPSDFPPLSPEEKKEEWGKQLTLGNHFARDLDLYRAITCYKSSLVFLPANNPSRHQQLEYDILLCYYLGNKYCDVIETFESSSLTQVTGNQFPCFDNLLIMLYDSYTRANQSAKAEAVFKIIDKCSPETALDLTLGDLLIKGELCEIEATITNGCDNEPIRQSLDLYYSLAKSPKKARTLNAILPGAGYWYVGQKRSAVTSFIINTLFIAAAYQFFQHGYPAAGIVTSSLELGWYAGGINGAGIEAQELNTRLYEGIVKCTMIENKMFPILTFQTAF